MATTPTIPIVDRIEPTKARLTWPTDATSIHTWYAIMREGATTPLAYPICNHDPAHHSDTPEWMPEIKYWLGNLTPATTYRVFIRMFDGGTWATGATGIPLYVGGSVSDSPVCEFTTKAAVPYGVLNAHLMDKAAGSVTLRCAHSGDVNAQGTATKYGLFVKAAAATEWPATPAVDNLTPASAAIGAFVTATYSAPTTGAYDYQFRAANASGWGDPSNTVRVTADGGPTDAATWAAFRTALSTARPGDIVRATAPMTIDTAEVPMAPGAVLDFGGFTHEFTAPVSTTTRLFVSPASGYMTHGFQARNGVIHKDASLADVRVIGFNLLGGADGATLVDLEMTGDWFCFLKLDSQITHAPNRHGGLYGTRIEPKSTTTVVDLGPAECQEGVIWGHTHYQAQTTGNDTTADGIANELATGFWDIREATVQGVNGDGIDLKFSGDYYLELPRVQNAVRNSLKAWGVKSTRGTVASPRIVANGLGAAIAAGTVTVTDGLFEGYGYAGDTGHVETAAIIWGNGTMDNGLPGYGGVDARMVRCNFRRRMPEGAVASVSLLTATDAGNSVPLDPHASAVVTFEDCLWYNAGTHPTLISTKEGWATNRDIGRTPYLLASQAQAGKFPANHDNSRWLDEDWSETDPDPPVNLPPSVSINGETTGLVGGGIYGAYLVTDPENDDLTITFGLSAPAGSTVELSTPAETWELIPDVAGTYVISVSANDGTNPTVTATHTITVEALPVEPPTAEKKAVAILFGWYKQGDTPATSDHWYVSDTTTNITYSAHTDVCPYTVSYLDKTWWKTELRNIKAAGFDVAAVQTYPYTTATVQGFPVLADAWQELYDAGESPVSLGFFCETAWLRGFDLTDPAYRDAAWYRLNGAIHEIPEAAWVDAMGENTPFLGFYTPAAGGVVNWNGEYFTDLSARMLAEYGATPYIAVEMGWDTTTRPVASSVSAVYAWSTHVAGPVDKTGGAGNGCVNIFVAYERAISQPWHAWDYCRYREDGISGALNPSGTWYDWCWQQAIGQNARVVMAQWNELAEGITLCQTVRFGRAYIDASAAWIQTWKAGADPGEPVTLLNAARVRRLPDSTPARAWHGVTTVELDLAQAQYGWWSVEGNRGLRFLRGIADSHFVWSNGELVSNAGYSPDFAYFDWTTDAWGYSVPATKRYKVRLTLIDKPASAGARLYLQYDARGNAYKTATPVTVTTGGVPATISNGMVDLVGDGATKTVEWTLTDARFQREENAAAHFRLVVYYGYPVYITHISVTDLTRVEPDTDTQEMVGTVQKQWGGNETLTLVDNRTVSGAVGVATLEDNR